MVSLTVLDVGHGSCAIVADGKVVSVIDGGRDASFLRFLREEVLERIDLVLISHADADHIRGFGLALKALPDLRLGSVLVNPAQAKRTIAWKTLVEHLELRQEHHGTLLGPLRSDSNESLQLGDRCVLEVLSPPYVRTLPAHDVNRMSGVVRVSVDGVPEALFTADIDRSTLDWLIDQRVDLSARMLVFPHHGGNSGGDLGAFGRMMTEAVNPEITLMSLGRDVFANPLPEIIAGIRASAGPTHIGCTQLSKRCNPDLPAHAPAHLAGIIPPGNRARKCCIGTVTVTVDDNGHRTVSPDLQEHIEFINVHVPTALCR